MMSTQHIQKSVMHSENHTQNRHQHRCEEAAHVPGGPRHHDHPTRREVDVRTAAARMDPAPSQTPPCSTHNCIPTGMKHDESEKLR